MSEFEMGHELEIEKRVVDIFGFVDYWHFKEFQTRAFMGMIEYGDRFTMMLGVTLKAATDADAIKIIRTWQNLTTQYEMVYRIEEAKKLAAKADKESQSS